MPVAPDTRTPPATRPDRATLLRDMDTFGAALAAPVDPDWRARVNLRLNKLQRAFAEHMLLTEGPDGLYAELVAHAPRLARGVHVLIREHAEVNAALGALRRRAALPEAGAEELRGRADELLQALFRHRQRGADLVYQAYQTDLGGET